MSTRAWLPVVVTAALLTLFPSRPIAQVRVERRGEENPVMTIAKSTIYGALTGLALGAATALVVQENEDDIIRWFVVGGTFFGFGYGVYHVASRPDAASFLALAPPRPPTLAVPTPRIEAGPRGRPRVTLTLLSIRY